jgi:hypothetical protein
MTDGSSEFAREEIAALATLATELKKVEEWPPDSPVSFVLKLASRTRGKLGEKLLGRFAADAGLPVGKAKSAAYDITIGGATCEVKFSTEDPPRFQQVRDPRMPDETLKYGYLICVSARPAGLVYWVVPARELSELMDEGYVPVQHAMSETRWFFPSRTESDPYSEFRQDYDGLLATLKTFGAES